MSVQLSITCFVHMTTNYRHKIFFPVALNVTCNTICITNKNKPLLEYDKTYQIQTTFSVNKYRTICI